MADYFVSQSGAGARNGTSVATAWAYSDLSSIWGTLTGQTLYVLGTITSAFSVGAHNSTGSGTPFRLRGDYSGNAGTLSASGTALTIPSATSRNHTHVYGLTITSSAGRGVLCNSGSAVVGRRFYSCDISNCATQGIKFDTASGHSYTDVLFDDCDMSSNGDYGLQFDIAGTSTQILSGFTMTNCRGHLNGSDSIRVLLNSGNSTAGTIDNAYFNNNRFYNNGKTNGGRGLRFGAATHTHGTGNINIFTNNYAIGNGKDGNQGGGLDLRSCAGDPAGAMGDTDGCYIAYNVAAHNEGENGGINVYGALNGVVEWNVCNDQYVSETDNASPFGPTIDGNGIIMDANSDNMECRYNSCSRNLGSAANNSGVGVMVLFSVDTLRVHHNFGYGNKHGLWSAHKAGAPHTDVEFTNNTFLDCADYGFHMGLGSPLENTVVNNLFTGAAGNIAGIHNADSTNLAEEDYNCFYNFTTASSSNGGLGANSITTQPLFEADVTYEDDFVGAANTKIDALGNIAYAIENNVDGTGVEGARIIELDGSGAIRAQDDGTGTTGAQTMYLVDDIKMMNDTLHDHDHWIEFDVDAGWTSAITGIYPMVRFQDKDNCIVARLFGTGATGLVVRSRIGGTESGNLITTQPTAGSTYRIECTSEKIELFKDGVSQGTTEVLASALDPIGSRPGLGAFQANAVVQWSRFEAGAMIPNMKPATSSPVIDAGSTRTYSTTPDGESHGQGSAWDIGAWEFADAAPEPILSSNTAATITSSGCTPTVTTTGTDGTLYYTVGPDGESSWRSDIVAGVLRDQTTPPSAGSQAVSGSGVQTFPAITDLQPATDYELQFVHVNAGEAMSLKAYGGFTTAASTAPTLSSPAANAVDETSVQPNVTTNGVTGTLYMVVVPDGDSPSVAQIKSGLQSSGAAAITQGTTPVTAAGAYDVGTVTGLMQNTAYEIFFVHTTVDGVDSSSSTVGFTTDALPPEEPGDISMSSDDFARRRRILRRRRRLPEQNR